MAAVEGDKKGKGGEGEKEEKKTYSEEKKKKLRALFYGGCSRALG